MRSGEFWWLLRRLEWHSTAVVSNVIVSHRKPYRIEIDSVTPSVTKSNPEGRKILNGFGGKFYTRQLTILLTKKGGF